MMIKHEIKYCPRCKGSFECKVGSILDCQCTKVKLVDEERDWLKEKFDDCLCLACMREMKSDYRNEKLTTSLNKLLRKF